MGWDPDGTGGEFCAERVGLYDLLGNVREWTCSVFDASYGGAEQRCNASGQRRVPWGDSWNSKPDWVYFCLADRGHAGRPSLQPGLESRPGAVGGFFGLAHVDLGFIICVDADCSRGISSE